MNCGESIIALLAGLGVPASARRGWGVRESGSVGTSRLPRGCSRRNRAPRVAANVEAAQTLGLRRAKEARRLGLGSLVTTIASITTRVVSRSLEAWPNTKSFSGGGLLLFFKLEKRKEASSVPSHG